MKKVLTVVLLGVAVAWHGHARAAAAPNDDTTIGHVLNRIGYGPRPGDVERIRAIGLQRYIDEQLHPDRIPDAGLAARLAPLTTVTLSAREIANRFELPTIEARQERQRNGTA